MRTGERRLAFFAALACSAFFLPDTVGEAALKNRWSFNSGGSATNGTVFLDSIGGVPLTVVGTGATLNGNAITLPGTSTGDSAPSSISAYLDLPNGIASSKTNFSLEVWATPLSNRSWARLFDFGNMARSGMGSGAAPGEIRPDATSAPGVVESSDTLMLALTRGGAANTQMLYGRINAGTAFSVSSNATLNTGTRYHFVVVYQDGVGTSGASGG